MGDLPTTVTRALSTAFSDYAGRVQELASGLSETQFWTRPYPYSNTFGHLVLHLTGNLNTYIGAEIAGTGYVRDREREFTEASKPPKDEVLQTFGDAIEMVLGTLETQSAEDLTALPADAAGTHVSNESRFGVFLHCAAHLYHHVGQMIYLEKALKQKGG